MPRPFPRQMTTISNMLCYVMLCYVYSNESGNNVIEWKIWHKVQVCSQHKFSGRWKVRHTVLMEDSHIWKCSSTQLDLGKLLNLELFAQRCFLHYVGSQSTQSVNGRFAQIVGVQWKFLAHNSGKFAHFKLMVNILINILN